MNTLDMLEEDIDFTIPINEEEINRPKMTFEEAVKACNGITLEEFFERVKQEAYKYCTQ